MSNKPDKVIDFKDFGSNPARGQSTSLYIGSKLHARSQGILKECNIRYILNVTPTRNLDPEAGCPNFFENKDPSLTYKRIAIFDNRGEEILQYMGPAISFIEQGKHYGSVLVHCNKGVSRSASFVLGYLMKTGGLRLDDALEMLKSKRSIVQPNDSFMTQLRNYDAQLEKERQDKAAQDQKHGTSKASTGAGAAKSAAGGAGAAPRAAIGPALPPHLQKAPPSSSASPSKASIGPARPPVGPQKPSAAIGPSLPPPRNSPAIGPSPPPPPASRDANVIGPSPPPPSSQSGASSASEPASTSAPAPAIGPAGPPLKRPIGPAMPPGTGPEEAADPRESKKSRS